MARTAISLDDVYTQESGTVFLGGIQALVRLPMIQVARDRAAGLDTGGFIAGYRGSPLGGYDQALARAKGHLDRYDIVVRPAVNEELAATAIWGTQQLALSPGHRKDGVFGIWYGKGPGVDRTGDVFKHANAAGTSPHGGVLCLAGDDHGAKSSTIPGQSDHDFMSALIPLLYPSSVRDFVRMGLIGIGMSRYSGCWVAMKLVSDIVESAATVDLADEALTLVEPTDFAMPEGGLNLRWPDDRWTQDHRLQTYKGYAALAYARANGVDRMILDPPRARFGIVASGKAFEEVREALAQLGIDADMAARIGLRLYQVGMPWPLEPAGIRHFSEGLQEVLVVEERREIIENQIKQHLFNWRSDVRPRIVGKFDDHDAPLFSLDSELSAETVAEVLVTRLVKLGLDHEIRNALVGRIEAWHHRRKQLDRFVPATSRTPFFCPGCPHNSSTVVPEGSRALAGIGCHFMAQSMNRRTETFTQMGGEGVSWMGIAPFTDEKHVFANLGDGTYFHSGILAVRQAVASGANITYKILFNDAVAMTGGQAVDGPLSVPQLTHQLRAEGVGQIYLLTREPERYRDAELAPGTKVENREAVEPVMEKLREIPGCTAIVYDQTCATELRRKRARGKVPKAEERAYINPAVCEGCGDCSVQSNCIAIDPLETEFGRKREINQSACNSDLSCLKGFCPSFVTVKGGILRKSQGMALPETALPEPALPALPATGSRNIAVTGVGGTGVLTVGHILGMAAHIDGNAAMLLDVSGLAQKGGAVISHLRLARRAEYIAAPHIPLGAADLLIAPDMVVAASKEGLSLIAPDRTAAVLDTHAIPVANFIQDRDFDFRAKDHLATIEAASRVAAKLDFHGLAIKALGDAIATNLMMVGYAWQRGLVPISEAAILEAIGLNAVSVDFNRAAFGWGRFAAAFPDRLDGMLGELARPRALFDMSLDAVIEHRAAHLEAYQDRRLAKRYRETVARIRARENAVADSEVLTRAVAINYAKVLAYKDEYEVGRLFADPAFAKGMTDTFEGAPAVTFHLAPPLLSRRDPNTGRPKKIAFGPGLMPVFRVLAALKPLRRTPLDPFRWSEERRRERALIRTYEAGLALVMRDLTPQNYACSVAIAAAPDSVRGYGPVKLAALDHFDREWLELLARFEAAQASSAPRMDAVQSGSSEVSLAR
jgi:indolepyruvate ferredoxin oxidoreductase